MKLLVIITQPNPEQVFTALRFANFAKSQNDEVTVFLTAEGVETVRIDNTEFDIEGQAETFIRQGCKIYSCGTCMEFRKMSENNLCTKSNMKKLYELVAESDKIVTF